jgi:biotin synthase
MGRHIAFTVAEILNKGADNEGIDHEAAMTLMALPLHSAETYALMAAADRLSRQSFGAKAENHFHIGLNVAPCPINCRFCSLARKAGIFTESVAFEEEQILAWARHAEDQGADALNLMTTGDFPFERLLEIGRLLKRTVVTPLVANTCDIDHKQGEALLAAGFVGAYHALRLGEGRDTPLSPERRIRTISVLKEVGLRWMNCVEPVGPEHRPEEIVALMLLARRYGAIYSGIMRRINFPGSPLSGCGMISELEMARMIAVSRLVMGAGVRAHCTHEPNSVALMAGANLFFPEVGSSPRDGCADTAKGRGIGIDRCRSMQREMHWRPGLSSNCFTNKA